ncbi:hypothetical protein AADZ86_03940 [Colwelliaceae bacterium BS250]
MKKANLNLAVSLFFTFLFFTFLIVILKDFIQLIHEDGRAYWLSSDGATYLEHYYRISKMEIPMLMWVQLAAVKTPILLLLLTGGTVWPMLLLACATFFFSLYSCTKYLERKRLSFIVTILLIPYVLFGFFAINKEIYLISSVLFFMTYYKSQNKKYLLFCILVLFLSRYYMLIVYMFCLVVFPVKKEKIRWNIILLSMLFISAVAPIILKGGITGYSAGGLLEGAGAASSISGELIRKYLYIFIYFPKYILLILSRYWTAYTSGIFGEIRGNLLGLLVAIYTTILFIVAFKRKHYYKSYNFRFLMMTLLAPVPLMFNDIFHWRYYVFTMPMLAYYLNQQPYNLKSSIYIYIMSLIKRKR